MLRHRVGFYLGIARQEKKKRNLSWGITNWEITNDSSFLLRNVQAGITRSSGKEQMVTHDRTREACLSRTIWLQNSSLSKPRGKCHSGRGKDLHINEYQSVERRAISGGYRVDTSYGCSVAYQIELKRKKIGREKGKDIASSIIAY